MTLVVYARNLRTEPKNEVDEMKHEKTKCKLKGYNKCGIAEWYCPKCKLVFQTGCDKTVKEGMRIYCWGIPERVIVD